MSSLPSNKGESLSLLVLPDSSTGVPGAGVIRYNETTNKLEISNDGGSFAEVLAGTTATIAAGTNINVNTSGSTITISTVAGPTFNSTTTLANGHLTVDNSFDTVTSTLTTSGSESLVVQNNAGRVVLNGSTLAADSLGPSTLTDVSITAPLAVTGNITNTTGNFNGVNVANLNTSYNTNVNQAVTTTSSPSFGGLSVTNTTSTSGALEIASFLGSAISGPTGSAELTLGRAKSNNNSAQMRFDYFSNGSTSNDVSLWAYGETYPFMTNYFSGATEFAGRGGQNSLSIKYLTDLSNNYRAFYETLDNTAGSVDFYGADSTSFTNTLDFKFQQIWPGSASYRNVLYVSGPNGVQVSADSFLAANSIKPVSGTTMNLSTLVSGVSTNLVSLTSSGLNTDYLTVGSHSSGATGALFIQSGLLKYYDGSTTQTLTTSGSSSTFTDITVTNISNNPLSTFINQAVKTTSSPSFSDATINGHLFSAFYNDYTSKVNQDVRTSSSPSFNGLFLTQSSYTTYPLLVQNAGTVAGANDINVAEFQANNMVATNKARMTLGLDTTTNFNSAVIDFNYAGNGLITNKLEFGFNNFEALTTIDGTGNLTTAGLLTSNLGLASNYNLPGTPCATITNNGTPTGTNYCSVANFITSSISANQGSEILFGRDSSAYNEVVMDFNYAGSGSTSNTFGIGFSGHKNLVTVAGNGTLNVTAGPIVQTQSGTTTFSLDVTNSGSSTGTGFVDIAKFMASNVQNGHYAEMLLGHDSSSNNCAAIDFNYTSSGSSGNTLGLGFYGANSVVKLNPAGYLMANSFGNNSAGSMYFRNNTATTTANADFYFSNCTADTVSYIITPYASTNTVYLKSKSSAFNVVHQTWISSSATDVITMDTNGVKLNYACIGTGSNAQTGGLRMSSSNFQYYDGSAWQTVSNNAGTNNSSVTFTATKGAGGITYTTAYGTSGISIATNPDNFTIQITLPSTSPDVADRGIMYNRTIQVGYPTDLEFQVTKSSTRVYRFTAYSAGSPYDMTTPINGSYFLISVFFAPCL